MSLEGRTIGFYCSCLAQKEESLAHMCSFVLWISHGAGPYYVEYFVAVEGQEDNSSFVVEVATLETLPNSVFAFLTLVDHAVYDGAEFFLTQSVMHLDSDETRVSAVGYGASALAVVEDTAAGPCAPYSVGFVGSTGGLKIIMTSDASKHGSLACFGRIAQGRQTMSQIQKATREGKAVSISSVKFIEPTQTEGEL